MRVIAGSAKNRKLVAPKGPGTRPALAQVKEAIFNILGDINGCTVLDLFAGCGAIGIEALSRGASHATFVDNSRQAIIALQKNLETCDFTSQAEIVPLSVDQTLQKLGEKRVNFDLIFVDPPYDEGLVMRTLNELGPLLADNGLIIVEHSPREPIKATDDFKVDETRTYGQTLISFLERI